MSKYTLRVETDEYPESPRTDCEWGGTMVCWHDRYTLGDEQPSESPEEWLNSLADSFLGDIPERVERVSNYFYGTSSRFGDVAEAYLERARDEALNGTSKIDLDIAQMRAANKRMMLEQEKLYLETLPDKPLLVEERLAEIDDRLVWLSKDLAREEARIRERLDKWNVVMLPLYLYDHSGITMSTGSFSCPWDSGQVGHIYMTRERAEEWWPHITDAAELRAQVQECLESEVEVYDNYLTGEVYGFVIEDEDDEEVESCWGYYGEDEAQQAGEEALQAIEAREDNHVEE